MAYNFFNHIHIRGLRKRAEIYCPLCGAKATHTRKPCQHVLFSLEASLFKEVTLYNLHPKLKAALEQYEKGGKGYWDSNDLAFQLGLDEERAFLLSVTVPTGPKATDRLEYAVAFEFPSISDKSVVGNT